MVKKEKNNRFGIIFFIILVLTTITAFYVIPKSVEIVDEQIESDYSNKNYCNSKLSCLCRDKCEEIYGHSEWESWLYKGERECWCLEKNETRRIF